MALSFAFIIILLVVVALIFVAIIWQPEDLGTAKTRAIKGICLVAAIALLVGAATLMLNGMHTGGPEKENDDSFDAFESADTGAGLTSPDSGATAASQGTQEVPDTPVEPGRRDRMLNDPGPAPDLILDSALPDDERKTPDKLDNVRVGQLSRESIRESIKTITPYVKACYEDSLKEFPDAAGKVVVSFTVIGENGAGRVELSELEADKTTLFDTRLHDCMLESLGDVKFEVPEGGGKVQVTYPFVFDSEEDD